MEIEGMGAIEKVGHKGVTPPPSPKLKKGHMVFLKSIHAFVAAVEGFRPRSPSQGCVFCLHRALPSPSHTLSHPCPMGCPVTVFIRVVTSYVLCVLGCRSVPENVTGEGRKHRTASS